MKGAAPFSRASFWMLPPKPEKSRPPRDELVYWLDQILEDARRCRDQHFGMGERWKSYRSWYSASGDTTWGKKTDTLVNQIYEKVESVSADLSEADPAPLYTPDGPAGLNLAEFQNHVVPHVWRRELGVSKYHESLKSACMYGTAYWKVAHDPGYPNIGPRVRILPVSPWGLFPAPYATSFEDAPYVIEVRARTVGEIKAEYNVVVDPEMQSRPEDLSDDMKNYPAAVAVETATGGATTGGDTVGGYYRDLSTHANSQVVFQKELWIKDGARVKEWVWKEDPDNPVPQLVYDLVLKYPEGRVISWAGDRVLYDRPSPYKDGEFPYVRFRDGTMPDFWYGQGEIEPLIPLQMHHDDTHEIIKLYHLFSAFGRLVIDTGTGLEEGSISNNPNEVLWVKPGTSDRIKWLHAMPPPPELYKYLGTLEASMDRVSGRFDVTRGEQPGSVTAARALVTLQQAANVRIRHRMKDIERSMERAFRLIGSRVQQFWTSHQSVAIQAPTLDRSEMVFKDFYLKPEDRVAAFNVKVSVTSNLSQAKEQEFQKKLLLHQMGIVDDAELVESADLTDEEEILQKMEAVKKKRMMEAALQAMAGQAGEQGSPGGAPKPGAPGGNKDQTRAGNEADKQARQRRSINRALTPISQ